MNYGRRGHKRQPAEKTSKKSLSNVIREIFYKRGGL